MFTKWMIISKTELNGSGLRKRKLTVGLISFLFHLGLILSIAIVPFLTYNGASAENGGIVKIDLTCPPPPTPPLPPPGNPNALCSNNCVYLNVINTSFY